MVGKPVTPGAFLSGGPGSPLGLSKTDVVLDVGELMVDAEQANPNLLIGGINERGGRNT